LRRRRVQVTGSAAGCAHRSAGTSRPSSNVFGGGPHETSVHGRRGRAEGLWYTASDIAANNILTRRSWVGCPTKPFRPVGGCPIHTRGTGRADVRSHRTHARFLNPSGFCGFSSRPSGATAPGQPRACAFRREGPVGRQCDLHSGARGSVGRPVAALDRWERRNKAGPRPGDSPDTCPVRPTDAWTDSLWPE
jgi:hypothetical protein